MDKLDEMVFLAIGRAQMCWKEFPAGASDEDRAYEVGKQLIAAIRAYEQEVLKKEEAAWHLSHPHIIRDKQGNIIAQSRGFLVPVEGSENAV